MTGIEWTDRTWNPVTGCTKVSPGCDHCYAEGIARRFAGTKAFPHGFDVTLHPERLDAPLRWRKPSRVFVNSMSDLFHDGVPDEFIARVFAVMAFTPRHTYQVLTKRHGRMRSLLTDPGFQVAIEEYCTDLLLSAPCTRLTGDIRGWASRPAGVRAWAPAWPLPNVWLGCSVEDQKRAELRIPALLATPAAVRFLSVEPLLGSVTITGRWHALDWVIIGGESGPGARPMPLHWARSLLGDCRAHGIAPFVKQLGSVWAAGGGKGGDIDTWPPDLRIREFPPGPTSTDGK